MSRAPEVSRETGKSPTQHPVLFPVHCSPPALPPCTVPTRGSVAAGEQTPSAVAASATTEEPRAVTPGMALRSGQVMRAASGSTLKGDSGSGADSDAEQASASRKRRRRSKAALDEYEYAQLSDPEERKLEKRRAKNRRTARVSRERKQAEVARMKEQLATQAAELARLKEVIRAQDVQIAQMKGVASSTMGAPEGGLAPRLRASESAALNSCPSVANDMLTKRTAQPQTAPPLHLTTCTAPSRGDGLGPPSLSDVFASEHPKQRGSGVRVTVGVNVSHQSAM